MRHFLLVLACALSLATAAYAGTPSNGKRVVFIGDSITDIKTAQNAGIDCVIVEWGYGDENTFTHEYPLKVISDFSQLYGLFDINYF